MCFGPLKWPNNGALDRSLGGRRKISPRIGCNEWSPVQDILLMFD